MSAKGKAGELSLVKYVMVSMDRAEYVMGTVRQKFSATDVKTA